MKQEYFSAYRPKVKEVTEEKQLGLVESFKVVYDSVNEYFGLNEVRRIDRFGWWALYIGLSIVSLVTWVVTL